ncbi:hypothetical protein M758_UG031200 [Ceratodon purpureus]|nr:hypothetical protein M758_UG031200 [Ceratodon purpureus]
MNFVKELCLFFLRGDRVAVSVLKVGYLGYLGTGQGRFSSREFWGWEGSRNVCRCWWGQVYVCVVVDGGVRKGDPNVAILFCMLEILGISWYSWCFVGDGWF